MILNEKNIIKLAFITSVIIHFLLFLPFNKINFFSFTRKSLEKDIPQKELTVYYNPVFLEEEKQPEQQKGIKEGSFEEIEKKDFSADLSKQEIKTQDKVNDRQLEKEKEVETKDLKVKDKSKQEDLSVVGIEQVPESQRPAFIQYYKFIRNKIEVSAHNNRPDYFKEGQVNVIFKLNSSGNITSIRVNESVSTRDRVLRRSAVDSVQKASPFPRFPQGLTADELEFRITIEFHI